MAALLGLLGGAVVGGGSSVGGQFLSDHLAPDPSDSIFGINDPKLDLPNQAASFDALTGIGFGDVSTVPSPIQQLVGRIQGLTLDEKTKRRALTSLRELMSGQPETRPGRLDDALGRLGITRPELDTILDRSALFTERQNEIFGQLGPIQDRTVLDRARAAGSAAELLGQAGDFATSDDPQNPFQQHLFDRVNRQIDEQENQFLLRSQFGGFQPGIGLRAFQDQRMDASLTALEQALGASAGLSSALGIAQGGAQASAGQATNANLGTAQIAANQAVAANNLLTQNAPGIGQAVSDAGNSFGSAISNAALLGANAPSAGRTQVFSNSNGLYGGHEAAARDPSGGFR